MAGPSENRVDLVRPPLAASRSATCLTPALGQAGEVPSDATDRRRGHRGGGAQGGRL